ncbi:MAG: hypothetical protein JWL76_1969 [Thermoleophilia bacterium]|nr:hypothetical protein [Thermoleophilia bacterium]
MNREAFLKESADLTRDLLQSDDEPWRTSRQGLAARGVDVETTRVVDRIDDGDYLYYMLIVTADERVFLYFVTCEPSAIPAVVDWQEITDAVGENPHAEAIRAVLSASARRTSN